MNQQQWARQDWTHLTENDPVEVTEANGRRYSGVVDCKTSDSTVIWVTDGSGSRRAFDHREGVGVTAVSPRALIA